MEGRKIKKNTANTVDFLQISDEVSEG